MKIFLQIGKFPNAKICAGPSIFNSGAAGERSEPAAGGACTPGEAGYKTSIWDSACDQKIR